MKEIKELINTGIGMAAAFAIVAITLVSTAKLCLVIWHL